MDASVASIIVAGITVLGTIIGTVITNIANSKKKQNNLIEKINQTINNKISATDTKINQVIQNTNKKIDTLEEKIIASRNRELEELKNSDKLAKEGIQAILRDRLTQMYRYCTEVRCTSTLSKAYATNEEKQNFNNMYQKYHSLGQNGVMDVKYEHFMQLPDYEPKTISKTTKKKTPNKNISK